MTKALHSKTCTIFILLFGFHYCNADDKHTEFTTSSTSGSDHGLGADNVFIKDLFAKYGQGGHMTYEGFEHLISSIGLGQIAIKDHILSKHKQDDGEFIDFHPDHHHHDNDSSHSHADHDRGSSDSHDHTSQRTSREVVNCHGTECMKKCLPPETILSSLGLADHSYINVNDFIKVCPALISQLDSGVCQKSITEVEPYHLMMNVSSSSGPSPAMVWGCSFGAVAFISLIGLVCVILIPILHKSFYHALLQLLVAMAVGTLTGDALLHLLPHAFSSHEHQGSEDAQDQESIWRGLVVLSGFYVFFNVERLLSIVVDKRQAQREKRKQKKLEETPGKDEIEVKESCGSCSDLTMVVHTSKGIRKMAADAHEDWHVLNNIPCTKGMSPSSSNEHLPVSTDPKYCQPTECGGEIHDCHTPMLTPCTEVSNLELCDDTCRRHSVGDTKDSSAFLHSNKDASKVDDHHHDKDHHDDHHGHGLEGQRKVHSHGHSDGHDHDHEHGKGHGHSHGHSHHVPKSVSSVAWMVIMGDGLHNFCDGMAVGAAFTTGLGGGLSTTVAILCHELPHELGDFAMLLQAGMTVKQAVVYNLASSILCVLGMVLGVLLGNISDASLWLFALTGGMFIYIALVDMLPELTAAYNGTKNPYHQLLVQNIGLLIGMSFMLLISLYEDSFLLDF